MSKPKPFKVSKPVLTHGLKRRTRAVLNRLPEKYLDTLDESLNATLGRRERWPEIGVYLRQAILNKVYARELRRLRPREQQEQRKFLKRLKEK